MSKQGSTSPLRDHLLLQNIFRNLSLEQLKPARLVCRLWRDEGAKSLRHFPRIINIHLSPCHMFQGTDKGRYKKPIVTPSKIVKERGQLKDFLSSLDLAHNLHVSLLENNPWQNFTWHLTDEDSLEVPWEQELKTARAWYKQGNDFNFAASLIQNFLPEICHLVKELRLELSLTNEKDLEVLENILELLEKRVPRVYLLLVMFPQKPLQAMKNHGHSVVKTLAVGTPGEYFVTSAIYNGVEPSLDPSSLISLFPNLSFLDLFGPKALHGTGEVKNKVPSFLRACGALISPLSGIRVIVRAEEEMDALFANFRQKKHTLRSFCVDVCTEPWLVLNGTQAICNNNWESLQSIDIFWRPMPQDDDSTPLEISPQNKLKTIRFCSAYGISLDAYYNRPRDPDVKGLYDIFELKENFSKGFLNGLENLSLILFGDEEIWAKIFPSPLKIISSRLKTLVISLIGKCEDESIQKFPGMLFPGLRVFRHGRSRDGGRLLLVCQHKYDGEGRLIGKWEWLGGVQNYLFGQVTDDDMTYVYTAKNRFELRLDIAEGFTDTSYHLECKDHYFVGRNCMNNGWRQKLQKLPPFKFLGGKWKR